MNTLKNHVILYDSECPMCKLYTQAFTTSGMLDTDGRAPYQDMPAFACPVVDWKRAVNEIALVDKTTGAVHYGIDSLFTIIANSCPIFKPLFSFKPFAWSMRKLYAFISYNRKVIIPAPKPKDDGLAPGRSQTLQPSFHLGYRIAWLLFTWAIVGGILTAYAGRLTALFPYGTSYREYLMCAIQILFQGTIVNLYAPAQRWDYLGNMMTISLAGALLLLPMLALTAIIHLPPAIIFGWALFIAAGMLLEHIRRSKLLGFGSTLTITWVLYRLIILGLLTFM
ncbi:MAG TPA: hypothetical protein VKQ52_03865 [Puia sp.]|nr:hypothetical protein [Puia sp.]